MNRPIASSHIVALLLLAAAVLSTLVLRRTEDPTSRSETEPAGETHPAPVRSEAPESREIMSIERSGKRLPVPIPSHEPAGIQQAQVASHPWVSIGGLTTPDPYPDASAIVDSLAFNPRGVILTESQYEGLVELVDVLAARLQEKSAAAQLALSEAVSWKVDLGMVELPNFDFGHPELGCANAKLSRRDGGEYSVTVRPGEFAGLDVACAEARVEALDGENKIRQFFAALN